MRRKKISLQLPGDRQFSLQKLLRYGRGMWGKNPTIAGIDEAGRGALAGPVVAGACILPHSVFRRRSAGVRRWSPFRRIPAVDYHIADSKTLTPQEREAAYGWITTHCPYGVGIADVEVIEAHGILAATHMAMLRALEDIQRRSSPSSLLVDGRDSFSFPLPHQTIVRGDGIEPCIAAASIVAKVTRDRIMAEYRHAYGQYGFERHKGYGTDDHRACILTHGPCALHRLSFLGNILQPAMF